MMPVSLTLSPSALGSSGGMDTSGGGLVVVKAGGGMLAVVRVDVVAGVTLESDVESSGVGDPGVVVIT